MYKTNIVYAKENLCNLVNMAVKDNEIININTQDGNALLINEENYKSLLETIYIMQDKETLKIIQESENNTNSDYWLDESELDWNV